MRDSFQMVFVCGTRELYRNSDWESIPFKGEVVVFDRKRYRVKEVVHDYDKYEIKIGLALIGAATYVNGMRSL